MDSTTFVFSLAGISLGCMGFIFGSAAYSKVQTLKKEVEALKEAVNKPGQKNGGR